MLLSGRVLISQILTLHLTSIALGKLSSYLHRAATGDLELNKCELHYPRWQHDHRRA